MEATDLMINDWILIDGKPVQVNKISDLGGINPEISYGDKIWQYDFQPIPLTPEILEKNGFSKNKYQEYAVPVDNEAEIYLVIDNSTGLSGYDSMVFIHCQYVHELQHLLKLCKIEKEIVL